MKKLTFHLKFPGINVSLYHPPLLWPIDLIKGPSLRDNGMDLIME